MGLFDQVVGALNNPNQQASTNQLSTILNVAQQLTGSQGAGGDSTQALMSVVGQYVRSSLQQTSQAQGRSQAESLVEQFAGTGANADALGALFSNKQQQQLTETAAQKTGLNASTIQSMLPVLVPLALNLLKTGASTQGATGGNNSVLNSFLDSDGDGDVDMGDALSMAGRFLSK
ncbi:MAG: hypothetical protein WBA57_25485 [Elainellaceae cyanobacterium]